MEQMTKVLIRFIVYATIICLTWFVFGFYLGGHAHAMRSAPRFIVPTATTTPDATEEDLTQKLETLIKQLNDLLRKIQARA